MTLYYTDPIDNAGGDLPVLTEDGNILLTGGKNGNVSNGKVSNNFRPFSTVLLLRLDSNTTTESASFSWLWLILPVLLLALLMGYFVLLHSKKKGSTDSQEDTSHTEERSQSAASELLMQRICLLMEEQKPFLNCELKVSDVATLLATNSRYISESIKATRGITFAHFINTYRVTYAQQLLRQQPDIKMTEVYIKSGFANETSFFRTFKAHTGMTPKEWLQTLPES
jgi:AraC-like DNA-binding protein